MELVYIVGKLNKICSFKSQMPWWAHGPRKGENAREGGCSEQLAVPLLLTVNLLESGLVRNMTPSCDKQHG